MINNIISYMYLLNEVSFNLSSWIKRLHTMSKSNNNHCNYNYSPLYALPIGYCFNEFEIEKIINKDELGIVYRAWDHRLNCMIAIKEYIPSFLVKREQDLELKLRKGSFQKRYQTGLTRFIQEAHVMSYFHHPCLPFFLRLWQNNHTAYIATPFYDGMTLKTLQAVQPKMINQRWICNILYPLLDAINILHQAGYLHCDISPDTILIQEDGVPILFDFSSTRKITDRLSDEFEVTIRPGFTPIEHYTNNEEEDQQGAWTDIYALGATLYTLITGSPPPVSIVRNIEDNYQSLVKLRPEGYSFSFLHAIDCTLALQPSERPMSISELITLMESSTGESSPSLTLSGSGALSDILTPTRLL
ncbi:hypothetical protein FE393_03495 [Xenorhabdus sp. psl]|nr:hypothetical protein [Xenorhabdus sp. psl]